jgi:hypothetical protein
MGMDRGDPDDATYKFATIVERKQNRLEYVAIRHSKSFCGLIGNIWAFL